MTIDTEAKRKVRISTAMPYLITHAKEDAQPIIDEVAMRHGITPFSIIDQDRRPHVLAARREAIAAVHKQFPTWSYPVLGRVFKRDHSTIMWALQCAGAYTPRKKD